ncbi:hypothetical protein HSB1_26480 [Halogranum salarium B-1]|uniref:Uncharacterized protein n=1 Tax=Halogranum salarium B-1 TaxID=1210908 RepID=J3EWI2_9EURY|nr:hypothetical protein HSB1_26480 [Halogranum salarium B-1]
MHHIRRRCADAGLRVSLTGVEGAPLRAVVYLVLVDDESAALTECLAVFGIVCEVAATLRAGDFFRRFARLFDRFTGFCRTVRGRGSFLSNCFGGGDCCRTARRRRVARWGGVNAPVRGKGCTSLSSSLVRTNPNVIRRWQPNDRFTADKGKKGLIRARTIREAVAETTATGSRTISVHTNSCLCASSSSRFGTNEEVTP